MEKKKCLISKGNINKYIFFALLAGVSKCFVSTMLYVFGDYTNYNKHPIIIGFNAGIGMSLSIIPVIIVKLKSHRAKKNHKLEIQQSLTFKGTKTKSSLDELNYLEKYDKSKLRREKYLILLLCAFLDFAQKFLSFFLKKLIINNIWIFNICFISVFDYFILHSKLYKHQKISCIIIVAIGVAATVVGLIGEKDRIFIKLILCTCIEIMYSLAIVCAKFLMDYRSCSPYEVTFYEGIFALIVNSILLAIFTNMPITDEDGKLDELLRLAKYDGKIYIDNFFATFSNMSIGEVFLFILSALGRLISNLFGHIVVKHYTSSHIILVLIIGEIGLAFKDEHGWPEIVQFSLFVLALFMLLIFTEIIEINACGLEENTRKNIDLREKEQAMNDSDNIGNILYNKSNRTTKIIIDDIEIEMNDASSSSRSGSQNSRPSDISTDDKIA